MIEHLQKTPIPPKRVVVLGASGFVGKALVEHLGAQHVEVVPISSADINLCETASVESLCKMLDEEDVVIFASALTPDRGRDIRTLMKNLAMGEHVSEALKRSPCSQVVYLSSDAVYSDELHLIREDSCCSPMDLYGLMHLTRERMLYTTSEESKIPLLILRPSLLYGINDTHNSYGPNRFIRLARETQTIRLFGKGEEKRDHVYVKDVAALIGFGLFYKTQGLLNVATGTSTSFIDVARMVAEKLGERVDIEFQTRNSKIKHRHFDISLTHRAFSFFSYRPLSGGLAETISQIRNS